MSFVRKLVLIAVTAFTAQSAVAGLLMKPTSDPDLVYSGTLLEGTYTNSISKPSAFLGFEAGQRVATPAQITAAIKQWTDESDRLKVIEYAKTHEGRPLFAVFISSPENLSPRFPLQSRRMPLQGRSRPENLNPVQDHAPH